MIIAFSPSKNGKYSAFAFYVCPGEESHFGIGLWVGKEIVTPQIFSHGLLDTQGGFWLTLLK